MHTRTLTAPWYQQFWPWFLIALPATAVVAGIATLVIAIKTSDGLVADDYYKQGLAINQVLERDDAARRLGVSALVRHDAARGILTVALYRSGEAGKAVAPPALQLRLMHPTRAHLDRTLEMQPDAHGTYSVHLGLVPPGHWDVVLEPLSGGPWRLVGRLQLPESSQVLLAPGNRS